MYQCDACGSPVRGRFCENCGHPVTIVAQRVCQGCGNELILNARFCPYCGRPVQQTVESIETKQSIQDFDSAVTKDEVEFYRGDGELIIKRTEHRGKIRKALGIAAGVPSFGIGYLLVGKDKTAKSKDKGVIVVTDKGIYAAGTGYLFDRIVSVTKAGKSLLIQFEKNIGGSNERISIEAEIRARNIDELFKGLAAARDVRLKGKGHSSVQKY